MEIWLLQYENGKVLAAFEEKFEAELAEVEIEATTENKLSVVSCSYYPKNKQKAEQCACS